MSLRVLSPVVVLLLLAALLGCGHGGHSGGRQRAGAAAVVRQPLSTSPNIARVSVTTASTTQPVRATPPAVSQPSMRQWPIPYGAARKRQMAAYSLRHYGEDTYLLSHPKVIVEHYTETATAQEAFNTFAPDVPDNEFHELPNTCAHFLVEPSGRIDQLVPLYLRCRHTTGLNWTAIGIENVGFSDQAILNNPAQIAASLRLTRWLRCRYAITLN